MTTCERLSGIIGEVLQIGDRIQQLDASSPLLGAVPEFDSIAVVNVITAVEQEFGIVIEDDDLTADVFETLGSFVAFVDSKR